MIYDVQLGVSPSKGLTNQRMTKVAKAVRGYSNVMSCVSRPSPSEGWWLEMEVEENNPMAALRLATEAIQTGVAGELALPPVDFRRLAVDRT